jgi:hypothetical protein
MQWRPFIPNQESLLDCSRSKPDTHQFICHRLFIKGDRMGVNSEQYRFNSENWVGNAELGEVLI